MNGIPIDTKKVENDDILVMKAMTKNIISDVGIQAEIVDTRMKKEVGAPTHGKTTQAMMEVPMKKESINFEKF